MDGHIRAYKIDPKAFASVITPILVASVSGAHAQIAPEIHELLDQISMNREAIYSAEFHYEWTREYSYHTSSHLAVNQLRTDEGFGTLRISGDFLHRENHLTTTFPRLDTVETRTQSLVVNDQYLGVTLETDPALVHQYMHDDGGNRSGIAESNRSIVDSPRIMNFVYRANGVDLREEIAKFPDSALGTFQCQPRRFRRGTATPALCAGACARPPLPGFLHRSIRQFHDCRAPLV